MGIRPLDVIFEGGDIGLIGGLSDEKYGLLGLCDVQEKQEIGDRLKEGNESKLSVMLVFKEQKSIDTVITALLQVKQFMIEESEDDTND